MSFVLVSKSKITEVMDHLPFELWHIDGAVIEEYNDSHTNDVISSVIF